MFVYHLLFRYFDYYLDSSCHWSHRFASTQPQSSDRTRRRSSQEEDEMTLTQLTLLLKGRRFITEIVSQPIPKFNF